MSNSSTSNVTCSKQYSDIPFAHRQHNHDGHCAYVHGHNWAIELTFAASSLDECGFVVDFGKLKFLKQWIDEHLDHALLLNRSDPLLAHLEHALTPKQDTNGKCTRCGEEAGGCDCRPLAKIHVVDDASCEGLAQYFLQTFDPLVGEMTDGRARVTQCRVIEDSKNSAMYMAPQP